ncbi:transglutaminase family protein [Kurthia sp. Dielmo]|uniref:transglutaminase-like domain-containing protein n=1 Tax=Kurthia sp. Dielmo TaxID=1033738 RepID=UPI001123141D|nr:transglutaminase family protein [Kurthia sp. Dielmo]
MKEFLEATAIIDYDAPVIQQLVAQLFHQEDSDVQKAQKAFVYVRDSIAHTWDIQSNRVTCCASDVFVYKEGFCYAKSHLLAAILRSQGIPTGFCYQKLLLFETPEQGYCLHGLNAIYLENRWIRVDARGNKQGVDAQFSLEREQLAFTVNSALGEWDDKTVYSEPNEGVIRALSKNKDAKKLYVSGLPVNL